MAFKFPQFLKTAASAVARAFVPNSYDVELQPLLEEKIKPNFPVAIPLEAFTVYIDAPHHIAGHQGYISTVLPIRAVNNKNPDSILAGTLEVDLEIFLKQQDIHLRIRKVKSLNIISGDGVTQWIIDLCQPYVEAWLEENKVYTCTDSMNKYLHDKVQVVGCRVEGEKLVFSLQTT